MSENTPLRHLARARVHLAAICLYKLPEELLTLVEKTNDGLQLVFDVLSKAPPADAGENALSILVKTVAQIEEATDQELAEDQPTTGAIAKDADAVRKIFFQALHDRLDVLLANFLLHNPERMPSSISVTELMEWTHKQS